MSWKKTCLVASGVVTAAKEESLYTPWVRFGSGELVTGAAWLHNLGQSLHLNESQIKTFCSNSVPAQVPGPSIAPIST